MPARNVMAELFGRADSVSGGMGGSMHRPDRERRFMCGYATNLRRRALNCNRHQEVLTWGKSRWNTWPNSCNTGRL